MKTALEGKLQQCALIKQECQHVHYQCSILKGSQSLHCCFPDTNDIVVSQHSTSDKKTCDSLDNTGVSSTINNNDNLIPSTPTSGADISSEHSDNVICHICPPESAKFFRGSRGLRIHWSRVHPNVPFTTNNISSSIKPIDDLHSRLLHSKSHIHVLRELELSCEPFDSFNFSVCISKLC
ncbi:hypothetical protein C0J52_16811 [Blattella germanica]|nr:hypothetical protein C0J52_16811 [Blattella germanica]